MRISVSSVTKGGQAWEVFLHVKVLVDALVGQSVVLRLISFHLGNEVHEVLGLTEEFQLFGVNQVSEFVFNLDD